MIKNVIKKEPIDFKGFVLLGKSQKTIKTYQSTSSKPQNQYRIKRP